MSQRTRCVRRTITFLVCAALAVVPLGCGGPRSADVVPADQQGLRELAAAYRDFFRKNHRAPKSVKELRGRGPGQGVPNALDQLNSGELVVAWGSPPADDRGDTVLAFPKSAPDRGGGVLMQDCRTIRTMTAEEFAAAPRAAAK
jgi:hypothetical protein